MLRQHPLHVVDVDLAVEGANDAGLHFAGNPDFQLRIEVQVAGGFDAEPGNAFVGDGQIVGFLAGEALLFHQNQALVGEDEHVAHEREANFDGFAVGQQNAVFAG